MTSADRSFSTRFPTLRQHLKARTKSVGKLYPGLHWEYDVSGSEYFPFRAYAAAVRRDGEEVLVISMQCYRPGGNRGTRVVLYADIARDGSLVLKESEKKSIRLLGPAWLIDMRIGRALAALDKWLWSQISVIHDEVGVDPGEAMPV